MSIELRLLKGLEVVSNMIDRLFWKNRRVLITGGTGFIGSWLILFLLELGAEVFVTSRSEGNPRGLFATCNLKNRVTLFNGDIRDKIFLKKSIEDSKPEVVFHLAAQPIFSVANEQPFYTYETNILGTLNVIEACHMYGVERIVFVTSRHWDGKTTDNISIYASSKACSEIVIRSLSNLFCEAPPKMSIVRMTNILGGGDCEQTRIIPYCLNCLDESKPIMLLRPDSKMRYIYVMDAVLLLLSLAQKRDETGIWNVLEDDSVNNCLTVEGIRDLIVKQYFEDDQKIKVENRQLEVFSINSGDVKMSYLHTSFEDAINDTIYINRYKNESNIFAICMHIVADYIEHGCAIAD